VSWYEFLLFAHISMAVIWVGGSTMMQFFGLRAIKAPDPMRLVQVGQDIEWIGNRVLIPASALAVVTGILPRPRGRPRRPCRRSCGACSRFRGPI
jgi:uncharacterized membrane protein